MATAKTDIFINSISGRLGNIVFYTNRGRQCVRAYVIPRNPDTEAQRYIRRSFGDAVRSWQALSPEERHSYNRKARYLNMSGYNLYISNYLKRIMRILVFSSTHEPRSKLSSLPWNLELSTWNFLPRSKRFPSVSPSYMLPYTVLSASGAPKHDPG
jgi:hypothetical protein